jgi:HSP20 family protein
MNMRDLIPWNRGEDKMSTPYRDADPFIALHREVNRLFDDVSRGFDHFGLRRLPTPASNSNGWSWPNIEVPATDREIRVTAELPGLDEKDVELTLDDQVLMIRGERNSETEDQNRRFSERFYGQFDRRIQLGTEIEKEKVEAQFKNGVLTIVLPKTEQAQNMATRIPINGK